MSLITQPQDRTKIEPKTTIKKFLNSSSEFIPANTYPNKDGQSRRYIPIGLSSLAISIKE